MTDTVKGTEYRVQRQLALVGVFEKFAAVWPHAFQPAKWTSMLEAWLDNCEGVETEVLEPAARDYIRKTDSKFPPKPWEFGKFARALQHDRFGSAPLVESVVSRRQWEWISPITQRISAVHLHGTEWVCVSLDDQRGFDVLSETQKIEYCDRMEKEHGAKLKRSA